MHWETNWQYVWSLKNVWSQNKQRTVFSLSQRSYFGNLCQAKESKNPEEGIREHRDVSTAFFINNIKKKKKRCMTNYIFFIHSMQSALTTRWHLCENMKRCLWHLVITLIFKIICRKTLPKHIPPPKKRENCYAKVWAISKLYYFIIFQTFYTVTILLFRSFISSCQENLKGWVSIKPTRPLYRFFCNFQICSYAIVPNFQYFA